ncbi:MAG: lipopolysaccharide biosynthesis protein [Blastocatellia bacterium]|nr:lipopolysaccharide biosynthesis protein [Blastocatellia bacterium]
MSADTKTTGNNTLSKKAALLALAKSLGFVLTLPMPLILVRALDQSDFGLYKQVFQILTTALALLGLHVSLSAYYFMPRNPDKKPQIVMNVLIFYAAVGGLAALLFAIYPGWIRMVFKTDDLVPYVPLLGLAILLWLLSSLLEVVTIADGDVRSASAFTVIVQFTKSALIVGAAVVFGTIEAVVIAGVVQGAMQCLILFIYLRKRFGRFWRAFDRSLFKEQLANALPFGIGALAYATQADLHNYFVSHYFEPAVFAIYAIGRFQFPLLGMLQESVVSILLPEVARRQAANDYEGIINVWASAIRKLAFFFVPAYTLMFVMRHEFITTLFTKNYAASAPIFAVNLLLLPAYLSVYTVVLRSFDELKYFRLKLSIAMIPVTCAALYIGINVAGLMGAITAAVGLQVLDDAIIISRVGRRLGMSFRDIGRLAPILRTVAAATVAGLSAYAVRLSLGEAHALVTLAIGSAVFGLVFLIAAYAAGAVTDEEKAELVRFYRAGSRRLGLSKKEDLFSSKKEDSFSSKGEDLFSSSATEVR